MSLSSRIDLDCISAAVFISPDTFLLETACSFNRTDTSPIWDIIWRIARINFCMLCPITAISSWPLTLTDTVKSPEAICVIALVIFFTGLTTTLVILSTRTQRTIIHTIPTIIIIVLKRISFASTILLGIYDTNTQSVPSTSLNTVMLPSIVVKS